jgi:hypothetical protein
MVERIHRRRMPTVRADGISGLAAHERLAAIICGAGVRVRHQMRRIAHPDILDRRALVASKVARPRRSGGRRMKQAIGKVEFMRRPWVFAACRRAS